jgi:hypothetical protein
LWKRAEKGSETVAGEKYFRLRIHHCYSAVFPDHETIVSAESKRLRNKSNKIKFISFCFAFFVMEIAATQKFTYL